MQCTLEVRKNTRREIVYSDDLMAIFKQAINQGRSDEPRSPGHDGSHYRPPPTDRDGRTAAANSVAGYTDPFLDEHGLASAVN